MPSFVCHLNPDQMIPVAPLPDKEEFFHKAFLMACLAPTEEGPKIICTWPKCLLKNSQKKRSKPAKSLLDLFDNPSTAKPSQKLAQLQRLQQFSLFVEISHENLTASQLLLLATVAMKPGLPQGELAERIGRSAGAISRSVDTLGTSGRRGSKNPRPWLDHDQKVTRQTTGPNASTSRTQARQLSQQCSGCSGHEQLGTHRGAAPAAAPGLPQHVAFTPAQHAGAGVFLLVPRSRGRMTSWSGSPAATGRALRKPSTC